MAFTEDEWSKIVNSSFDYYVPRLREVSKELGPKADLAKLCLAIRKVDFFSLPQIFHGEVFMEILMMACNREPEEHAALAYDVLDQIMLAFAGFTYNPQTGTLDDRSVAQ